MKLDTGHINVFDLYKFAAEHPVLVSGKNGDMKEYSKLVNGLVGTIPADKPGWYLWGRFNEIGFWETVYLGKAGNKATSSLQARIKEELLDERAAFWATVYGFEPIDRQFQKTYQGKYGSIIRPFRKRGVHFIVWVSASPITEEEVKEEESVLIAAYRPAINIHRSNYTKSTQYTDSIVQAVDREVSILRK